MAAHEQSIFHLSPPFDAIECEANGMFCFTIAQSGQKMCQLISVTRSGDLLDFGQHLKAFGNN